MKTSARCASGSNQNSVNGNSRINPELIGGSGLADGSDRTLATHRHYGTITAMDYKAWRKSVDQFLQTRRPDIKIADLDPNAAYQAFQHGMSPLDFVQQPTLVLHPTLPPSVAPVPAPIPGMPPSTGRPALGRPVALVAALVVVIGGGVFFGRHIFDRAQSVLGPKLVTIQQLKKNNVALNGAHVRIVGYVISTHLGPSANQIALADVPLDELNDLTEKSVGQISGVEDISRLQDIDRRTTLRLSVTPDGFDGDDKVAVEGVYSAEQDTFFVDKAEKLGHVPRRAQPSGDNSSVAADVNQSQNDQGSTTPGWDQSQAGGYDQQQGTGYTGGN